MYTFKDVKAFIGQGNAGVKPHEEVSRRVFNHDINLPWLRDYMVESEATVNDLRGIKGQVFGSIKVQDVVKVGDNDMEIHLYQPPILTNDTNNPNSGKLRYTEGIRVKFMVSFVRGYYQFVLRARDNRDYGNGGYYHMSTKACLGSYASTIEGIINHDLPLPILFSTISTFLLHRNAHDVAGNWKRYGEGVSERKDDTRHFMYQRLYNNLKDRDYIMRDFIETWGECDHDNFVARIEKDYNRWKEKNGLNQEQHTEG